MKYDNTRVPERYHCVHRLDVPKIKTFVLLAAAATLGGCMIYPDGRVTTTFDQATMKMELQKADREFGNSR